MAVLAIRQLNPIHEKRPWSFFSNPVYHQRFHLVLHTFTFSKKGISLRTTWLSLVLYLKPLLLNSLYLVITGFYTNWSNTIRERLKWREIGGLNNSKNGWVTNNGGLLINAVLWPLCKLWKCLLNSRNALFKLLYRYSSDLYFLWNKVGKFFSNCIIILKGCSVNLAAPRRLAFY